MPGFVEPRTHGRLPPRRVDDPRARLLKKMKMKVPQPQPQPTRETIDLTAGMRVAA
jgi:hypothetical protein